MRTKSTILSIGFADVGDDDNDNDNKDNNDGKEDNGEHNVIWNHSLVLVNYSLQFLFFFKLQLSTSWQLFVTLLETKPC